MNQDTSFSTSTSSSVGSDAISRRAYELWENEGRPEGCDLKHWLQAEQELAQERGGSSDSTPPIPSRNSDVTPLQGTRAAAAVTANRDATKRMPAPVPEKNGSGNAARKKPASAPAL